jgi:uncharacterized protein YecA (UPF0149 family)
MGNEQTEKEITYKNTQFDEIVTQYHRAFPKTGRNQPCPCGKIDANGKPVKYKKCCLKK